MDSESGTSGVVYAAMRHRVPDTCIQLAKQPGSRPMTHEPDPIHCIASDWPWPGAVNKTRLQRSRAQTGRVNRSQRMTPTPSNDERAIGTLLIGTLDAQFSTVIFRQIVHKILYRIHRTIFSGGKLPKLSVNQPPLIWLD